MKIYTKKGDSGKSSIINGGILSKKEYVFEVLGTMDELNAALALAVVDNKSKISRTILGLQEDLFSLGAVIASYESSGDGDVSESKKRAGTALAKSVKWTRTSSLGPDVRAMVLKSERLIDELSSDLPELKNFILPGGSIQAKNLHISRAVCRRLERSFVSFVSQKDFVIDDVSRDMLIYFNRLSDLLFVLARYANHVQQIEDTIWLPKKFNEKVK